MSPRKPLDARPDLVVGLLPAAGVTRITGTALSAVGLGHPAASAGGAPPIHRELRKLGIGIAQATVARYLAHRRGTPPPANLAGVPLQSGRPACVGRLLHRLHRHVPRSVRVRRAVPQPSSHRAPQRDGASNRGVDRAPMPAASGATRCSARSARPPGITQLNPPPDRSS